MVHVLQLNFASFENGSQCFLSLSQYILDGSCVFIVCHLFSKHTHLTMFYLKCRNARLTSEASSATRKYNFEKYMANKQKRYYSLEYNIRDRSKVFAGSAKRSNTIVI